jgi:hypothetical protein
VGSTSAAGRNPDEAPTTIQIGERKIMSVVVVVVVLCDTLRYIFCGALAVVAETPQNAAKRRKTPQKRRFSLGRKNSLRL